MFNLAEYGKNLIMNTYNRFPIIITKGEGMYVYDDKGKKYLDFVAGIAVNSLGHGNKRLTDTICSQAKNLIHISNLYYTEPQISLAKKLIDGSCFEKVFFCNSGAEGIEGALKLARKYAAMKNSGRFEIISMKNSFHGRTFAAVTATGQEKYQKGLAPLPSGFKYAEFNNFESLEKIVNSDTCAVLLEPIQGEGGVTPANKKYLQKVRELCYVNDIALIFDEIQCGVGRTGQLFAYQYYDIEPDIAVFAKGLAGGVPIGAIIARNKFAEAFTPGDHASTFGGNPLATAAGNAVLDEIFEKNILENVRTQGKYLTEKLLELKRKHGEILDVRGVGFMQGIELNIPVGDIINKCIENGLLLVNAGTSVIRFVPALIASKEDIDEAIDILDKAMKDIN